MIPPCFPQILPCPVTVTFLCRWLSRPRCLNLPTVVTTANTSPLAGALALRPLPPSIRRIFPVRKCLITLSRLPASCVRWSKLRTQMALFLCMQLSTVRSRGSLTSPLSTPLANYPLTSRPPSVLTRWVLPRLLASMWIHVIPTRRILSDDRKTGLDPFKTTENNV